MLLAGQPPQRPPTGLGTDSRRPQGSTESGASLQFSSLQRPSPRRRDPQEGCGAVEGEPASLASRPPTEVASLPVEVLGSLIQLPLSESLRI